MHTHLQGVVKEPAFKKFKSESVSSEAAARKFLTDHDVAHYYDLCAAYHPDL
jgi:hypothetical protein